MWGPTSVDSVDTHGETYKMKSDFIQIEKGLRAVYPSQVPQPPAFKSGGDPASSV